ncbi:MAG TPA: DUF4232 domain-containing protein [Pseudonocardiaceae bacterium]|nr:DUF4232 domain-containing protein [Pseudonocardiaceae bacterium]
MTTDRRLIAVSQGSEAPGTSYYPLEFTNTGGHTCSLSGYPVVSAISRAGVGTSPG